MSATAHDDSIRIIAGDCTTRFEGTREREQRGRVVCVVKPDNTVLVHDADGYQPVAWLTRPETLIIERDPLSLRARDGDQRLSVAVHDECGHAHYPASDAGIPIGGCPHCDQKDSDGHTGTLVRARGTVTCTDCAVRYSLPTGAMVLTDDAPCDDCGLPRMRVARGDAFELCLDRACESLDDAVRAEFDRAWPCPDCDGDLRVLRRGGLLAGCEQYPDCSVGFAIPDGVVTGECDCGLPTFAIGDGRRCLDSRCRATGA